MKKIPSSEALLILKKAFTDQNTDEIVCQPIGCCDGSSYRVVKRSEEFLIQECDQSKSRLVFKTKSNMSLGAWVMFHDKWSHVIDSDPCIFARYLDAEKRNQGSCCV